MRSPKHAPSHELPNEYLLQRVRNAALIAKVARAIDERVVALRGVAGGGVGASGIGRQRLEAVCRVMSTPQTWRGWRTSLAALVKSIRGKLNVPRERFRVTADGLFRVAKF